MPIELTTEVPDTELDLTDLIFAIRLAGSSPADKALVISYANFLNLHRKVMRNASIVGASEGALNLGSLSGAVELDLRLASALKMTLAGGVTLSIIGVPPADQRTTFLLTVVNPGAFSISWPASADFGDAGVGSLPAAGRAHFLFTSDDGGTSWDVMRPFTKTA